MQLPRLYAIIDAGSLSVPVVEFACELVASGVTLIQYRNKQGSTRQMLSDARELRRICPPAVTLIMNDRPDLALAADLQGVHLGQDDLTVDAARRVCHRPMVVGVSTHNLDQLQAADASDADYIAIGPVFPTASKNDPEPVVGLEGVRLARSATRKPLVAIGGISLENCRSVVAAGADSVAVISGLSSHPRESSAAFLRVLL